MQKNYGFKCPKCNHDSMSVAAMNYKETQVWNKSGNFSGSGVGIGSGGIGIGAVSGSYSEVGEIATKRADKFAEPQPYTVPVLHLILPLIMILIAVNSLPTMLNFLSSFNPNPDARLDLSQFQSFVNIINIYFAPIYSFFVICMTIKNVLNAKKLENELNSTKYPEKLARYNELRYCENCHTLFDDKNNCENANEIGLEKLLNVK
jgi:hypothetical protein